MDQMNLSARAHARILKVSRTLADLEASEKLLSHHVLEAINYRTLEQFLFNLSHNGHDEGSLSNERRRRSLAPERWRCEDLRRYEQPLDACGP